MKVCLASASPRRSELLAVLLPEFGVVHTDVDEAWDGSERPSGYVARLAVDKADAGLAMAQADDMLVVGADTVVVIDDHILGKPRDREDAAGMLTLLSGRSHAVYSGVALAGAGITVSAVSISRVVFRPVSEAEIDAYWGTGEPADKAGAYAIQGLASQFIERLEGSYSGVMGLPLYETARLLSDAGLQLLPGAADKA